MNIHNPTPLRHHVLKPLLLLLLLFAAIPTWAQDKPTVEEFIDDTSDPTASELYYKVKDNSGISPGLIKVLINAEVESFDGLMVEDEEGKKWFKKNPGEYWVLMAAYDEKNKELGAPLLKVNFKDDFQPLEVVFEKFDNIKIEPLHTYVLKINVPEKELAYDDDIKYVRIKITPPDAKPILTFDSYNPDLTNGEGVVPVRKRKGRPKGGEYPYDVTTSGDLKYKDIKGAKLYFDDIKNDALIEIPLEPVYGTLRVMPEPSSVPAKVYENGQIIGSSNTDIKVQAGRHIITIKADGYKEHVDTIQIPEGKYLPLKPKLKNYNNFTFTSKPNGAKITLIPFNEYGVPGDSIKIGETQCTKDLTTGEYGIQATKAGYLKFDEKMTLSSDNPNVHIKLLKIYNYKNEFYAEGNFKAGSFMGYGATIGGYFQNVNAEVSYLMGSGKSETIYWSGNTNITLKLGYGIPLSNRYRITPQAGVGLVKLKETIEEGGNTTPADGANTTMGLVGVRFSAAIANHFAASISPEFGFSMSKSKGYEALSEVSSDVKKWGEGFNVKLGLTVFF